VANGGIVNPPRNRKGEAGNPPPVSRRARALSQLRRSHGAQRPGMAQPIFSLAMRRGRKIAKVAMARRLAVRMYWMWRKGWDYEQMRKFSSHAGQPGNRDGVPLNTE
jgi:hypothetical protein